MTPQRRAMVLAATVLALTGCGTVEQPLLEQFFGASRLRDTTALQRVSTVIFEPLQQGIVRSFRITGVTGERLDGQAVTKEVAVDATVVMPDGRTVEKALVVTMQHAAGNGTPWIVTGFRDAGAAR